MELQKLFNEAAWPKFLMYLELSILFFLFLFIVKFGPISNSLMRLAASNRWCLPPRSRHTRLTDSASMPCEQIADYDDLEQLIM